MVQPSYVGVIKLPKADGYVYNLWIYHTLENINIANRLLFTVELQSNLEECVVLKTDRPGVSTYLHPRNIKPHMMVFHNCLVASSKNQGNEFAIWVRVQTDSIENYIPFSY